MPPALVDELFRAGDILDAEVEAVRRQEMAKADLRVDFQKDRYRFLEQARKADSEAFQRQLERSRPHWSERPAFVVPVTVVAVLAVIVAVAAVLGGSERVYAEVAP